MRHNYYWLGVLANSLAIFLLANCAGNEEENHSLTDIEIAPQIQSLAHDTTALDENYVSAPEIEEAPIPPAVGITGNPHIDTPEVFAQDIFATDNVGVPPWLANYVGSYGLLPTRFQDHGPFLYSFDISPDADIFNDDDLAPPFPFSNHHDCGDDN